MPDLVTGTADAMVIRKRPNACPHEASLIRKTHIESRFTNKAETEDKYRVV